MIHQWRNKGGYHCGGGHNHDVFRVLDPAKRIVPKQNVAHRPPANRRYGGNNNDPEQIHFSSARSQGAGHGFSGDTQDIENG